MKERWVLENFPLVDRVGKGQYHRGAVEFRSFCKIGDLVWKNKDESEFGVIAEGGVMDDVKYIWVNVNLIRTASDPKNINTNRWSQWNVLEVVPLTDEEIEKFSVKN